MSRWICRRCGETGIERITAVDSEYERLKRAFDEEHETLLKEVEVGMQQIQEGKCITAEELFRELGVNDGQ